MTLRHSLLILTTLFNFICSIYSLIAFFSLFPKLALFYFFISLPITIYIILAKPNKLFDTPFSNTFATDKLESNPF